jgi:hypothetical protein
MREDEGPSPSSNKYRSHHHLRIDNGNEKLRVGYLLAVSQKHGLLFVAPPSHVSTGNKNI